MRTGLILSTILTAALLATSGCGNGTPQTGSDGQPPAEYQQHGKPDKTKNPAANRPKGYPAPTN